MSGNYRRAVAGQSKQAPHPSHEVMKLSKQLEPLVVYPVLFPTNKSRAKLFTKPNCLEQDDFAVSVASMAIAIFKKLWLQVTKRIGDCKVGARSKFVARAARC